MNQIVAEYFINAYLSLAASEGLALLTLAELVVQKQIEGVARMAGSRFRWAVKQIGHLTKSSLCSSR